jgi:hypothetical protein
MLICRLSLWCGILVACGQAPLCAQPFLAADRLSPNSATSGLVSLGWNPSPDTNVTGYFLCWGYCRSACTNLIDAGNSTSVTVAGLEPGAIYYFTVVAHDDAGDQAPPSNVVTYPPGPTLNLQPSSGGIASAMSLDFEASAGVTYSLQATLDFQHWTTLFTTNCAVAGLMTLQDSDRADYPTRFYRLLQQ